MPSLTVAGIEVEPGNRVTRVVDVDIGDRSVEVPVIAVNGAHAGPHVAITGGVHGAEYVAIEAARRLGMAVNPGELHGSLAVVPISNTTSFYARSIYTSGLDDKNLNRVFPGDPGGSPSEVLADWLFRSIIKPAQYYVDMHGGDMIEALVPFVLSPLSEDPAVQEASRAMAVATGIPLIIHGDVAGSTCGAAAAAGIPSILAEFGGQGVWSEALVCDHMTSTMRVLYRLGVLLEEVTPVAGQRVYETFAWMRAETSGLFHPVVNVGERVEQGRRIGAIVDYFGETRQVLAAVASGEVAFLVTALAINAGDPLLAICA